MLTLISLTMFFGFLTPWTYGLMRRTDWFLSTAAFVVCAALTVLGSAIIVLWALSGASMTWVAFP
jgi:hypothetical protein